MVHRSKTSNRLPQDQLKHTFACAEIQIQNHPKTKVFKGENLK
jgi:hypothetical protein